VRRKGAVLVGAAGPGLSLEVSDSEVLGGPMWAGEGVREAVEAGKVVLRP
jgi:hypothetical protein